VKAILVRVGVDQAYGAWNAPVNPETGAFVYVPIPDGPAKAYTPGNTRGFAEIDTPLADFVVKNAVSDLRCPESLRQRNMNPSKAERLSGVRLAFAQGGPLGARLVYLTPPVEIKRHRDRVEAVWSHPKMPFRYSSAPILVSNTERSHFPRLEAAMAGGGRSKPEGQFSSNFRTRSHCLDDAMADEIVGVYTEMRRRAPRSAIARSYDEALPWPPPKVDGHRERTYERLLAEAREGGSTPKNPQQPSRRRC
jgi:hypothetical protein